MIRFCIGLALFCFLSGTAAVFCEDLQEITVHEGDTVWSIAKEYLKAPDRWPEILKYNNLPVSDPSATLPGMKLKVPVLLIKEHLRKATLVHLLNDVRFRKKDEPSWGPARKDMDLYNQDGLRTLENSEAHVRFYSGDLLKLDANSLVVLRPELKQEEVNLLSGTLQTSRAKTITPTAQISPRSEGTVYKTRVRTDKSTIVQVERGSAEVLGLDTGRKVIVPAGHANITMPNRPPSVPVEVPRLADFQTVDWTADGKLIVPPSKQARSREGVAEARTAPSDRLEEVRRPIQTEGESRIASRVEKPELKIAAGPPKVDAARVKKWKAYRLQVARDPQFRSVVWEKKKDMPLDGVPQDWKEYGLPDGHYYRRVAYIDPSGAETVFYPFQDAYVDTVPPQLTLLYPQEGFRTWQGDVSVEGRTDPDCFLVINDYSVEVKSDGKFYWSAVLVKEGTNLIRIVATDRAGNSTQLVRSVIYRKY
jgi:hypothetical protein